MHTRAREYLSVQKSVLLLLCLSCLCTSAFVSPSSAQVQLFLVGNVHAPDSIKHDELKQIFLGKKTRWQNDSHISFALFADEYSYGLFLREFIGKTASQYKNYWKKQVFSGKGRMPKTFKDPQDVLEFLAATDGAICFLSNISIDSERLKIIRVE